MINEFSKVTVSGQDVRVPSSAVIRSILGAADPKLAEDKIVRIQRFVALLLLWNEKLSLTAIVDPVEIISRHFGESALGIPLIPAKGRLADVGSGPGFPGLALKIFCPELQVLLIEQNNKKAAFLNEAIRTVGLPGISVERRNYLDLSPATPPFDRITARALGDYRELLSWAHGRLVAGGKIVLWLGSEEGIKLSRISNWAWDQPTRIEDSRRREILVGAPI